MGGNKYDKNQSIKKKKKEVKGKFSASLRHEGQKADQ